MGDWFHMRLWPKMFFPPCLPTWWWNIQLSVLCLKEYGWIYGRQWSSEYLIHQIPVVGKNIGTIFLALLKVHLWLRVTSPYLGNSSKSGPDPKRIFSFFQIFWLNRTIFPQHGNWILNAVGQAPEWLYLVLPTFSWQYSSTINSWPIAIQPAMHFPACWLGRGGGRTSPAGCVY